MLVCRFVTEPLQAVRASVELERDVARLLELQVRCFVVICAVDVDGAKHVTYSTFLLAMSNGRCMLYVHSAVNSTDAPSIPQSVRRNRPVELALSAPAAVMCSIEHGVSSPTRPINELVSISVAPESNSRASVDDGEQTTAVTLPFRAASLAVARICRASARVASVSGGRDVRS